MTWFEDPASVTETAKSHNLLAICCVAEFPSGTVRLTTWPAGLTINGEFFSSVHGIASIKRSADSTLLIAETRIYELSGVDPSVIPESEIDNSYGRDFTEYHVRLNPETHAIVSIENDFDGRMGRMGRLDGPEPRIQLNVGHRMSILDQADGWRRTDQHQQEFFPGDTGYRHAAIEPEVFWGGLPFVPGMGGFGGGGGSDRDYREV